MENELDKMTAVEWLESIVNGMIENGGDADLLAVIEHIQQAKKMDKEQRLQDMSKMQIISDVDFDGDVTFMFKPKKYYAETYGKRFIDLVSDEESKVHEVVRKLKEKKN
jgi:hypothetical protein